MSAAWLIVAVVATWTAVGLGAALILGAVIGRAERREREGRP